jgi:hypothetical protein
MKRNILKTGFTGALLLLVFACADLNLPDDGRITYPELFSTYVRIRNYYNNCIGYIPSVGFTYSNSPLASFSDEAQDASDNVNGSVYDWYHDRTSPNNPLLSVWAHYYQGIGKCNTFLKYIDDPELPYQFDNQDEKDGFVARVRVARAFYYLQLIKRYGGVPVIDTPYEFDHDFSMDKRASFEEIADFIISECDAALATKETEGLPIGFRWNIADSERGDITRAFAYAVKSQTALFAASPLWFTNGSKYTWEKATVITKEALDQCLAHGFKLYDTPVDPSIAQNPYAYYFITRSDGSRSWDKETIYESRINSPVWSQAGLPITAGMSKAGAGPSQELVDSYEMQETGESVILGYSDASHLIPIPNPAATDYNSNEPYKGRDPRFYASIYYNEAPKNLNVYSNYQWDFWLEAGVTDMTIVNRGEYFEIETTGGDPYYYGNVTGNVRGAVRCFVSFEYQLNKSIDNGRFFYWTGAMGLLGASPENIPLEATGIDPNDASKWKTFTYDLTEAYSMGWGDNGVLRFDPGTGPGYHLLIRNQKIVTEVAPTAVETFVGGNCGISDRVTDVRFTRTGYYMRKFNNYKSNNTLNADGYMRIFRLAELYLNFAEAAYQSAGPDAMIASTVGGNALSAREAVNTVRTRAGMPGFPTGLSEDAFEKKYRNERRVELAFEEHRFFDVRRWKILSETDRFVTGMKITKEGIDYTYTRIKLADRGTNADKYLMLPLSAAEAMKMKSFTGVDWQNPGW